MPLKQAPYCDVHNTYKIDNIKVEGTIALNKLLY
jgi:hypothetical protein